MPYEDIAERWARLRFAVIGKMLLGHLPHGQLQTALKELAKQLWEHPSTGVEVAFSVSTIERWYYLAQRSDDPIRALRRQIRSDAGSTKAITAKQLSALEAQYRQHPSWSYQLHADNLRALVEEKPVFGTAPSYTTVRRAMKRGGWRKRPRKAKTAGQQRAQERLEQREVRSFEVSHAHALWHFDFHEGRRHVVDSRGDWHKPFCLCILDDFSRLACHAQWYLAESTETLDHGLMQAFLKRGRPRGALSDNGGPMIAEETENGLCGLSIEHETTLPYSPYQNGKQETFWERLEGRLMSMLEAVEPLTLSFLNQATQAWLEQEYNRTRHDEIGTSPLERMLEGPEVSRPCPSLTDLRFHFTVKQRRTQRRSDGTISIEGTRFEIPSRLRNMDRVSVRYARWDLSQAHLVDPRDSDKVLARIIPQDKQRNANRHRRVLEPATEVLPCEPDEPVPPLLRKLLADYAATGLPPAYLPHEKQSNCTEEHDG